MVTIRSRVAIVPLVLKQNSGSTECQSAIPTRTWLNEPVAELCCLLPYRINQRKLRATRSCAFQYGQIRRLAPNRVVTGRNDYGFEDDADKLEQAAALDLPILIITGTYDPIFEPRLMQKLHNALPNSTLHEIKDSGHSPYFERPEIWNQLVLDHFAESR